MSASSLSPSVYPPSGPARAVLHSSLPPSSVAAAPYGSDAESAVESEWSWHDIDKPTLRAWLTDHKQSADSSTRSHVSEDAVSDEEYRQLLLAHVSSTAASSSTTGESDGGAVAQPPSPLSPDSDELADSSSEDDERDTAQSQQQQEAAAAMDSDNDHYDDGSYRRSETTARQKRRRDNGGSAAPYATSDSDDERDDVEDKSDEEEDEEDEWESDDKDTDARPLLAATPPPSSASSHQQQPASPSSSSSSSAAVGSKQRRVVSTSSGPCTLFDPPPFPLRSWRTDVDIEPTQLPAADNSDGVDPALLQSNVPRPAPLTSLFDSLYSVPAEVVYELRDESETESEDETSIASRIRMGCRFTALAGRRFAVPREPATFGWDWQASIAIANRSAPIPPPLTASTPSSAPSPTPSTALSSPAASASSSPAPSLTFPATVEPGVAAHDGFDLPPVALPFVGFASVSVEEVDDERQRKRRRREDDARQHIPLAFRMRLDEMRDSKRGRGSSAASPALSHSMQQRFFNDVRMSHSPSSLLSTSLPSSPSSSSALLSLLDPPMPSKRWRQAWAALTQQLPQPVRALDFEADSAAAVATQPLSPRAAVTSELDDTPSSNPTAARSSSPSPLSRSQPHVSSSTAADASVSPPHAAGRDSPGLPSASSASPPPSPRASLSLSSSYESMSARRTHCRLLAELCVMELRRRSARSLRLLRDTSTFALRLTRDMAMYWRRHDREVVEMRRRLEREEAERRKKEFEMREAERQRKKLEFLLTQTELYSHFIGSKMGITAAAAAGGQHKHSQQLLTAASSPPQSTAELNRMERDERMAGMTEDAAQAARQFMESKQRQTAQFDADMNSQRAGGAAAEAELGTDDSLLNPSTMPEASSFQPCPTSFVGSLKSYQLKGMNWLINLYDQGINGILADEMGLGKTIQSIAFLAFLSSVRQFWGPFLVVCPNSTLHQWQQEVSKFCPSLRVLPYWGSQQDRALLRKYWTPSSLGSADSSFHVLVTSYHTIVADAKYFNRLKWQYLLCLAHGTPVSTQCGLCRPIEQCVESGMRLLSCSELGPQRGRLSVDRLKQGSVGSNDRGRRAVVRVTLEDGRHIDCTGDHRILTVQRGWVGAANLHSLQRRTVSGLHSSVDEIVCGPDGVMDSQPAVGSEEWEREWSFHISCPTLQPFHMRSTAARQRTLSLARLMGYVRTDGSCCHITLTGHANVEHRLDADLLCSDIREVCGSALASSLAVSRHPDSSHLLRVALPSVLVSALLHVCGGLGWSACGRLSSTSSQPAPLPPLCVSYSTPLSVVRESLAGAISAAASTCSLQSAGSKHGAMSNRPTTQFEENDDDDDAAVAHRLASIRSSAASGIRWLLTPVTLRRWDTGGDPASSQCAWLSQVSRMLQRLGVEYHPRGVCGWCPSPVRCSCVLFLSAVSFHSLVSFRYSWSSQLRLSIANAFLRQQPPVAADTPQDITLANGVCSSLATSAHSPTTLIDWLERTGSLLLFARRRSLLSTELTLPSFRLRVASVAHQPASCDVFDLSVLSHPSFVAAGCVVHNCDEAQSLKNAASQRWKSLLNLRCRNRVLLTGTPIQNSMAELWALLHFIMPEFFDSHEEFNEWFSREIEDAAEEEQKMASGSSKHKGGRQKAALSKRSTFQSRQLARLHLILKPFMLRRVKKDVENEMPPKVELLLDCPLSRRQRVYYRALTAKVRGAAASIGSGISDKLMNLVMQFRKVVNHPQLMLHHRSLSSPLLFSTPHHFAATRVQSLSSVVEIHSTASSPFASPLSFAWPARLLNVTSNTLRDRWLYTEMSIFAAHYVHRSLTPACGISADFVRSPFSFSRFVCLSSAELSFLCRADPLLVWLTEQVRVHRFDQMRAPLMSALLTAQPVSGLLHHSAFGGPLLSGVSSNAGRSMQALLLIRSVECPLLAPRVLNPVPLRARLRVRSSLSSCLTLTSRTGVDEGGGGGAATKQSTIDEALTQADRILDMQPFGLDQTKLHPNGDGAVGLLSHHRQLLATLTCCLSRVAAPLPFPYLPGTASPTLRARLGYPGYCGWEASVLSGVDLVSHASTAASLPLPSGERVPASLEMSHSVAPEAWVSRWHGLAALSNLAPTSAAPLTSSLSGTASVYGCLPHTAVAGPLSAAMFLCPPQWFVAPTPLQLISDSGKLQRLDALLSKLYSHGHRVLIFSQMTRMLDLLGEYLLFRRYRFARLDGQTSLADRRDLVRRFQTDPTIFAFILSTRAGGLGINLTAADTVIFFDNDWNPTQDAQAMDRSHRIGQNKPVTVYRMVCRHTVEERILNRAQVKFNIQKNVYAGGFKLQKEQSAPQRHGRNDADDEADDGGDSAGRAADEAGRQHDDEAVEPAIDPATLFKSNELRELMLAEEDEQAWDTDYYQSTAGRGRDRVGRRGRYGEDVAAEHDFDLADHAEYKEDSKATSNSHSNATSALTATAAAVATVGTSDTAQQSQQATSSSKAASSKPPRPPTKTERAAAERAKRKEEKAVIRDAKEKEKREREEERRRKREAKQREKDERDAKRKLKAAEKHSQPAANHHSHSHSHSHPHRAKTSAHSKKSGSGANANHRGKRKERVDGSSSDSSTSSVSSSASSDSAHSSSSSNSSSSSSRSSSSSSDSSPSASSSGEERDKRKKSRKSYTSGKKTTHTASSSSSSKAASESEKRRRDSDSGETAAASHQ